MLGFAGEMAAGKGTATSLVKIWYLGTPSVRFSDALREFLAGFNDMKSTGIFAMTPGSVLIERYLKDALPLIFSGDVIQRRGEEGYREFARWLANEWILHPGSVKADRQNLQALSTALRRIFAENILEQTVIARTARMKMESPVAVIEGIRRLVDIGTLLQEPNFRLIYIAIDPVVAYQRMVRRNENVGDREMTFERFMELRNAEAEQEICSLKPHAHLVIDNSGPPEVMETILRREVAQWIQSSTTNC